MARHRAIMALLVKVCARAGSGPSLIVGVNACGCGWLWTPVAEKLTLWKFAETSAR